MNQKLHIMIWREKVRVTGINWNLITRKFGKWLKMKLHIIIWREKARIKPLYDFLS